MIASKSLIISQNKVLRETLDDDSLEKKPKKELTELHSGNYHLIPADLSQISEVESKLISAGVDFRYERTSLNNTNTISKPTIFFSECVLIYMKPKDSNQVIEWISTKFASALFCIYEQLLPNDSFGAMMVKNLEVRAQDFFTIGTATQMCSAWNSRVSNVTISNSAVPKAG